MPSVELFEQEWQQILGVLADRPWREVNTLVMKIGGQLQAQQRPAPPNSPAIHLDANGKEAAS